MLVSRLIFSVRESAAKLWGDTQNSEVVWRYSSRANRLGPARQGWLASCVQTLARQADGAILIGCGQVRKHVICGAPRKVVGRGNAVEVGLKTLHWIDTRNHCDAARLAPWRPPQQKSAHHAEHRGVHGDAKRQSDNGNCSEARIFAQRPRGKRTVLRQSVECGDAARFAAFFLRAFHTAKLDARPPQRLC